MISIFIAVHVSFKALQQSVIWMGQHNAEQKLDKTDNNCLEPKQFSLFGML